MILPSAFAVISLSIKCSMLLDHTLKTVKYLMQHEIRYPHGMNFTKTVKTCICMDLNFKISVSYGIRFTLSFILYQQLKCERAVNSAKHVTKYT